MWARVFTNFPMGKTTSSVLVGRWGYTRDENRRRKGAHRRQRNDHCDWVSTALLIWFTASHDAVIVTFRYDAVIVTFRTTAFLLE